MTFKLNRSSKKQLQKMAKSFLDDAGRIQRYDKDQFMIWGKDPILGTSSSVGVEINKSGVITSIDSWSSGTSAGDWDNQFYKLEVNNPAKTIKQFENIVSSQSMTPTLVDMTNPQPVADALNSIILGLAGGPNDVYVAFGEYYAFA